ncbi:hypothetical protein M8542_44025 [Amycolatopsis sp. OK19-0408]|uniref:Lactonase family protein with 7-bladed beta-propeller n=1 Tax=Amycolatopsis iheyensis TaxID=2945988 RepID=A0A9X2SQK3_9PSEU|nr:hypothetical protein [Amycolatopsis iheyensis]MCR6489803.1 hypothetical protein [Amycolatopsis iheyensis]
MTNAGSNTLSVLRVLPDRLQVVDVVPTGDGSYSQRFPNIVTQRGDRVYVLNASGEGTITGFRLGFDGKLTPIPGSTRQLAANQDRFAPDALKDPIQVSFSPDGQHLLVSIKDGPAGPGRVLTSTVDAGGRPGKDFVRTDFANRGPFGFDFDKRGNVEVAEFVGGGRRELPHRRRRAPDADQHGGGGPPDRHLLGGHERRVRLRLQLHLRHGLELESRP